MSGACCVIKADLSRVVVVSDQGADAWSASDLSAGDAPTAGILSARARTASDWAASLSGVRKKLGVVCVDVEDIRCRWVRATGTAAPIVSAATRGLDQDWEAAVLPERVEPILKDDGSAFGKEAGGAGVAVLTVADALPRIFLDEMDKRGVRAGEVMSLWHGMARAWDDGKDGRLVCVLLGTNDGRLIWSWSRGGRLLAGGSAPIASGVGEDEGGSPEGRAARRISLDWLTWSVQLGLSPDVVVAVGAVAGRAAGALGEQWDGVALSTVDAEDAVERDDERGWCGSSGDPGDARQVLVGLTGRPTRATRSAYRWGALGLAALAVAAIGIGVRLSGEAGRIRESASVVGEESKQRVVARFAGAESQPSIDLYLQQQVAKLQQGAKFQPPADPAPFYEELERLIGVIGGLNGVKLQSVTLGPTGTTSEFTVEVPDTRTGEELKKALRETPMAVAWSEQRSIGPRGSSETTMVFRGQF
ncbi:MAG: hypothetical protein R3B46_04265 [Phycisphaerales bacterium]